LGHSTTKAQTVSFIDEGQNGAGKSTVLRRNVDHPGNPFPLTKAPAPSTQSPHSPDSKLLKQKPSFSGGLRFFSDAILNQVSDKLIKSS